MRSVLECLPYKEITLSSSLTDFHLVPSLKTMEISMPQHRKKVISKLHLFDIVHCLAYSLFS
jgi:hypothetical protein